MNGSSFPAQDGVQWLDLTGVSNSGTGVQQVVTTVPGATYDLSFYVGNIFNPGGIFGTTSTVNLLNNGILALVATNMQGTGTTTLNWQQFAHSFTAAGASTTLAFINNDPNTADNFNGLDNIVLTARGAATVPEPSTLALLWYIPPSSYLPSSMISTTIICWPVPSQPLPN